MYTCVCFLTAGIDTSRLTLRWALYHMAVYPEIQAKVQEEIDSVVGKDYMTVQFVKMST